VKPAIVNLKSDGKSARSIDIFSTNQNAPFAAKLTRPTAEKSDHFADRKWSPAGPGKFSNDKRRCKKKALLARFVK
jgi:hypothetical protein